MNLLLVPPVLLILILGPVEILGQEGQRGGFLSRMMDSLGESGDQNPPQINMNVIIVPIIQDDDQTKGQIGRQKEDKINSDEDFEVRGSIPRARVQSQTSSNSDGDNEPPATGVIPEQPRNLRPCRRNEIYDQRLRECVARMPGSCPMCRRQRGRHSRRFTIES